MSTSITIANHQIGYEHPTYIVAEMSANGNQSYDHAVDIIYAAKNAGANAIKFQTYTPDTMTIDSCREYFQIGKGTIWEGKNLYALYNEAFTQWEWQPKLKRIANEIGLDCFSTPFDPTAVDFLEKMGVPAHKIASFEVVDIPLIQKVAKTGKPIIMSTGMALLDEIHEAVEAIRITGHNQLALLKCTSAYPAMPEEMNLLTIPDMIQRFGVPVGLSDHTLGIATSVAAVALGACIVEKHFTLSRNIPGPDSGFSTEPKEFKDMVDAIRIAEKARGRVSYDLTLAESASRIYRRSLFIVRDVQSGEVITEQNVRSIRPGQGLPPKYLGDVLGSHALVNIKRGTPLAWDLIDAKPGKASR